MDRKVKQKHNTQNKIYARGKKYKCTNNDNKMSKHDDQLQKYLSQAKTLKYYSMNFINMAKVYHQINIESIGMENMSNKNIKPKKLLYKHCQVQFF